MKECGMVYMKVDSADPLHVVQDQRDCTDTQELTHARSSHKQHNAFFLNENQRMLNRHGLLWLVFL